MNIYFACSITGGREFEPVFQQIVAFLLADGHIVPTSHLASSDVMYLEKIVTPRDVFERDVSWIEAADVLLAEVSTPSHGVGFEIGLALRLKKPVLCIYKAGRAVSKMLLGNPHECLSIMTYETTNEAVQIVRGFLSSK